MGPVTPTFYLDLDYEACAMSQIFSLQNSPVEDLNHQSDSIWRWDPWGIFRFRWSHEVGVLMMRFSALVRRDTSEQCFLSLCTFRHWGKAAVRKGLCAGQRTSLEPNHSGTLTLVSQPPELWENKFLFFKSSNLWQFVMVIKADFPVPNI